MSDAATPDASSPDASSPAASSPAASSSAASSSDASSSDASSPGAASRAASSPGAASRAAASLGAASRAAASPAAASPDAPHGAKRPLLVALGTTAVVTALSYLAPEAHANALVAAAFLGATWLFALRDGDDAVRDRGLALGGLLESSELSWRRLLRDARRSAPYVLALAALVFPPFVLAYRAYWHVSSFSFELPQDYVDRIAGQLLVVALPEEAFFRGYLQSELERAWQHRRWRVFGVELGVGWLAASLMFALGHLLTVPVAARLAVFFPALLFGWLRAKTGGIGAALVFHALCNLLSSALAIGYAQP